ncbi:MAG: hypothetical protein ACI94Y_004511 [Maribacter sp.]|jgi:hypothetical protein
MNGIPETIENRHFIGVHKNQHGEIAVGKILAIYDVCLLKSYPIRELLPKLRHSI